MRRSSGNEGDGSMGPMRGAMDNNVNDSHHTLTQLIGAARDAFGEVNENHCRNHGKDEHVDPPARRKRFRR